MFLAELGKEAVPRLCGELWIFRELAFDHKLLSDIEHKFGVGKFGLEQTLMRYIGWIFFIQSSTIRLTSLRPLYDPMTLTVLP